MNESELQNFSLEEKRLNLIDVSYEDDCLYASPSGDSHFRLSDNQTQAKSNLEVVDATGIRSGQDSFGGREQGPELAKSMEPEMAKKSSKYNLRKSLAWDSAFFTSAGVLEPEELSNIIGGEKAGGKYVLPGIEEEVHRSSESIASDNLMSENIEDDLFGDIRASIQRSTTGSHVSDSSSKGGSPRTKSKTVQPSAKADAPSRNKSKFQIKTKATLNKPSVFTHGSEKTTKQSVPINGESKSLCRPPKIVGRLGPISAAATKRASLGANRVKVEKEKDNPDNTKTFTGRAAKVPAFGCSRTTMPRPTLPVKPSLQSSAATKIELTSSSVDRFGSLSSDCSSKSSVSCVGRKSDSRTGNQSYAGSTAKTALKIASRNKNQSMGSHLSPYLKSVTKLSPSISPASSVSEWSSASLSPTSTLNKVCNNSRSSSDIGSCKETSSDTFQVLDSQNHFNDELSVRHVTQVGSLGECINKVSTESSAVLHLDTVKPSGLRLPSPKIGFFDGVKFAARTPNRSKQSHPALPSSLPVFGSGNVNPRGGSNKTELGKLQPARTVVRSAKMGHQTPVLGMKSNSPKPSQEASNAVPVVFTASENEKCSAGISKEVQNIKSPQTEGKTNLNTEKIGLEECDKALNNSGSGFIECNGNPCLSVNKQNTESKGDDPGNSEITPLGGLPDMTIISCSIPKVENTKPKEKVGKDVACRESYNILPSFHGIYENEKAFTEDEFDGLSKETGAFDDIHVKMDKEAVGDSLSLSQDDEGRIRSGIQDKSKELSEPTLSPTPAIASKMAETENAVGIQNSSVEEQVGLTKQFGCSDILVEMHKEAACDSLSLSQDDAGRIDSHIQEQFKMFSKPTCFPTATASKLVEAEKAAPGTENVSVKDEVDGLTKQIGALDIHVEVQKDIESLSLSENVRRVDSSMQEEFIELSRTACSPTCAIVSTMAEVQKADAGTLPHQATSQGKSKDGKTSQQQIPQRIT